MSESYGFLLRIYVCNTHEWQMNEVVTDSLSRLLTSRMATLVEAALSELFSDIYLLSEQVVTKYISIQ